MGVIVRQKKKGRGEPWWIFITHQGKRRSKKIGSKTAALEVAAEIQARLGSKDFNIEKEKPVPIPTFQEYSKKWLSNYIKVSCRESTFEEYSGILDNHILPVFKDTKINLITRGAIRDFLLSKIKTGLSR